METNTNDTARVHLSVCVDGQWSRLRYDDRLVFAGDCDTVCYWVRGIWIFSAVEDAQFLGAGSL